TLIRPLEERIVHNSQEIAAQREWLRTTSERMEPFLQLLREMAREDPKLSALMRTFSLL
ncbi:MAG: hypothetical protein HQL92_07270, partial [Magnetococcales bacterium]|nr:hypothetical protein [Magnetococcales bacterium]